MWAINNPNLSICSNLHHNTGVTLARTPEASISCPGRAKIRKPPALMAGVANVHMRPAGMQCTRPIYTLTDLGQLIRPGDGPSRAHCGDLCKQHSSRYLSMRWLYYTLTTSQSDITYILIPRYRVVARAWSVIVMWRFLEGVKEPPPKRRKQTEEARRQRAG